MLVLKPGEEVPLVDPLITSPGKRPGSRGSRPGSRGSSAGRVERTGPTIKRKEETVIEGLADALRELRVEGEAVVQTNESKLGHRHNPELTLKEIHDDSQPIDDHVDDDDEDEESSSTDEESSDEDDDEMTGVSAATKSTTSPLVPVELLSKFLSLLMSRDYEAALPICSQILEIEPQNETCLQYLPLLEYAVNNDVDSGNEESGGSEEDDDDDGEDDDEDESESSNDEDDDDDEESDSNDDEDEEEDDISVEDLKGVNMFMGGFVKSKST